MSYTKGPWIRMSDDHREKNSAGDGSINGPNGEIVAMGCWHNDSTAGLVIDNPADEALILAAPALLEAAQQVIDTYGWSMDAWETLKAAVEQALDPSPTPDQ